FHIGEQRPHAERDRDPLPGRHRRIRALTVEAPRPAGREHDGTGVGLLDVASVLARHDGDRPRTAPCLEAPQRGPLANLDAGIQDPTFEGLLDRKAGRVAAGMEDPRPGVGGLSSRGDLAVDRVERNTVADQIRDPSRGFVAESFRGRRVHEPGSRTDRVLEVKGRRIVGSDRGGDTALSVPSGRLFESGFRDQRRSQAEFSTSERDVESRDARTDNERTTRGVAHVSRERTTGYSDFSTRAERRIPFRPPGTVAEREPRSPRPWENVVSVREDVPLERELLGRLENGTGLRSVGVTDLISLRRAYYRTVGPAVPIPAARQARLDQGRSVHRTLGARLAREGILEARVCRDGLVGRIDILADLPIEVKTSSGLVSPSELPAYRPDHIEQLGMYCGLVDRPVGRLLTLVASPSEISDVQAVDVAFRSTSRIREEMRRRADLLRTALKETRADGLPRCPWFGKGCEYQEATVCSCTGEESRPLLPLTDEVETLTARSDVQDRIRSELSRPSPSKDEASVGRFREVLYPRRAYFERTAPAAAVPEEVSPPALEPDLYARLSEAVESGTPGEVARLPARSLEPEEEVVGFRGRPLLLRTSRAWARFRENELVSRSPQYSLDLGLRCAITGTDSALLVIGFERAESDRDRLQVLELRFSSLTPFSRIYRERSQGLADAIRERTPARLPSCPDWMTTDCPYRSECGCGTPDARVTR